MPPQFNGATTTNSELFSVLLPETTVVVNKPTTTTVVASNNAAATLAHAVDPHKESMNTKSHHMLLRKPLPEVLPRLLSLLLTRCKRRWPRRR